jgi:CheY-like chemotaxis protein
MHVAFAGSGMAAIAKVCATFEKDCKYIYPLIVMDFDMPNMNGAQCAKLINTLYDTVHAEVGETFARPTIVCLTSNNTKETLNQSLAAGMIH